MELNSKVSRTDAPAHRIDDDDKNSYGVTKSLQHLHVYSNIITDV